MQFFLKLVAAAVLALAVVATAAPNATPKEVLVIDLGNQWLKAAVVNPANPNDLAKVDVVIDEQSERKRSSAVGFVSADERVFGHGAESQLSKKPQNVVFAPMYLLGEEPAGVAFTEYLATFPALKLKAGSRSTFDRLVPKADRDVSVEGAVAMVLQYVRELSVAHIKQTGVTSESGLQQVVLLVPDHLSSAQRTLLTQLAELAGLKVLTLVNELSGAAIDYAVRTPAAVDAGKTVVFFDMGSMGATASLIKLGRGANNQIEVTELATASDLSVGGVAFDRKIRDLLVTAFDKANKAKIGSSVAKDARAMAKLLGLAKKAKETLSVGDVATVQAEALYEGVGFKTTVTVQQFNAAIAELVTKALAPISKVMGDTPIDIELVGNAWRVPHVQDALAKTFPKSFLGKHVDADESPVLGASHLALLAITKESERLPSFPSVKLVPALAKAGEPAADAKVVLSAETRAALLADLDAWAAASRKRVELESAMNELQSAVFSTREFVEEHKKAKRATLSAVQSALKEAAELLEKIEGGTVQAGDVFDDVAARAKAVRTAVSADEQAIAAESEGEEESDDALAKRGRAQRAKNQKDRNNAMKMAKEQMEADKKKAQGDNYKPPEEETKGKKGAKNAKKPAPKKGKKEDL